MCSYLHFFDGLCGIRLGIFLVILLFFVFFLFGLIWASFCITFLSLQLVLWGALWQFLLCLLQLAGVPSFFLDKSFKRRCRYKLGIRNCNLSQLFVIKFQFLLCKKMLSAGFEPQTSHTNDGRSRPLKPLVILLFKVPFFLIRDIYRNCLKTGRSKTDLSGSRRTSVQYSDPFLCPKSGSPKSRHSKHLKTGHKARPFHVKTRRYRLV